MTSLPSPPKIKSEPPRPRISSSPLLPDSLSRPSVPESMPPLGQPGMSLVVMSQPDSLSLKVRVWLHRASSDDAAPDELPSCSLVASVWPCSSCGATERIPAHPTNRTTQQIKKG